MTRSEYSLIATVSSEATALLEDHDREHRNRAGDELSHFGTKAAAARRNFSEKGNIPTSTV
jgi:hypothetical protein